MRNKKQDELKEIKLDESVISQFRRYLSEIKKIQSLATPLMLSWWDK